MTTLLQRMYDELVRRNYAATTIRTYLHALRTCERYHRGPRGFLAEWRQGLRQFGEPDVGCVLLRDA
ncbi:MAG TPA: hypothetical protein VJ501_04320 [Burkholderiaceae bacterium]|nr:hypothetical protein [Burkholderiaceae bacterium]